MFFIHIDSIDLMFTKIKNGPSIKDKSYYSDSVYYRLHLIAYMSPKEATQNKKRDKKKY